MRLRVPGLGVAAATAVVVAASPGGLLPVRSGPGRRLAAAPRTGPGEAALAPAVDALGGEVVRLHARDGVALAARWLQADVPQPERAAASGESAWVPDPHEAILLLHGYSGSCAPDLVEYGPFLVRTASVLGLDFRGHGRSDDGPTTFGMLETEDVGGALDWLGARGITTVALCGISMGAATALTATAILGDGTLTAADSEEIAAREPLPPPRPRIVAIVADSVMPRLEMAVAGRWSGFVGRFTARRAFDSLTVHVGADPRATEPARIVGLVDPVPILLVHGAADRLIPADAVRRLATAAGPGAELWVAPAAGHAESHATNPADYERRVSAFLQAAFSGARTDGVAPGGPIISPGRPGDGMDEAV